MDATSSKETTRGGTMGPPQQPTKGGLFRKFARKRLAGPLAKKLRPMMDLNRREQARVCYQLYMRLRQKENHLARELQQQQHEIRRLEVLLEQERVKSQQLQTEFEQLDSNHGEPVSPITTEGRTLVKTISTAVDMHMKQALHEDDQGLHKLKTNTALAQHRVSLAFIMRDRLQSSQAALATTLAKMRHLQRKLQHKVAEKQAKNRDMDRNRQ